MDEATAAVARGAPEGVVIVADEQTAGRGRRGHRWQSPGGAGLYMSIVLRPDRDDAGARVASLITLATGVAVRNGIGRLTGVWADLKWPNDLIVGKRKLAGILAEGHGLGTDNQAIVLGIGVNVRHASLDPLLMERATSLEAELGRRVSRGLVLEEALVAIAATYDRLRGGDADAILREWCEAAPSAVGATVVWDSGRGRLEAITAGLDDDGALRIRTSSGIERVIGGELQWV